MTDYPVVTELRKRTPSGMFDEKSIADYADYIQATIAEHVAKGHYTQEYAEKMTFAELYAGNDGE